MENLIEEIKNFINEKVKDLPNHNFLEVMGELADDIEAQIEACQEDED